MYLELFSDFFYTFSALPAPFRGWKFSGVAFTGFRWTWAVEHRCPAQNVVRIASVCETESHWDMSVFCCLRISRDIIFRIPVAAICQVSLPSTALIIILFNLNLDVVAYNTLFTEKYLHRGQVEWSAFEWMHLECLPDLIQLACFLPHREDTLRNRITKVWSLDFHCLIL